MNGETGMHRNGGSPSSAWSIQLERHYRAVSYATGVRKVVKFGSAPVKLDATMIDAIKERLNNGYVILKPVRPMYGQVVHIWVSCRLTLSIDQVNLPQAFVRVSH